MSLGESWLAVKNRRDERQKCVRQEKPSELRIDPSCERQIIESDAVGEDKNTF